MKNKLSYFTTDYYRKNIHNVNYSPLLGVFITLLLFPLLGVAQVGINTIDVDFSAILEIESTDKGVLFPSLTELERDGIETAAADAGETVPAGLTIYCEDCCQNGTGALYYYNGVNWKSLDSDCKDVNTDLDCLDMVATIINIEHMSYTATPPLLTDGLFHGLSQVNWQYCKMHDASTDKVRFTFNQTIPEDFKIQLFFYIGANGIRARFKMDGSLHQNVLSATLPSNATLVSIGGSDGPGESGDYVLTVTLEDDTDEVYVTANGEHPYLYEIKVLDTDDNEIPLTCD